MSYSHNGHGSTWSSMYITDPPGRSCHYGHVLPVHALAVLKATYWNTIPSMVFSMCTTNLTSMVQHWS